MKGECAETAWPVIPTKSATKQRNRTATDSEGNSIKRNKEARQEILNRAHRFRLSSYKGLNQTLEARQFTCTVKHNPEVQAIAAHTAWIGTFAC
jgi:hypothetical protein